MPGQKAKGFTTVGKAKMATKQYNSPLAMYSEDIITEIMTQVNTNVVFLTAGQNPTLYIMHSQIVQTDIPSKYIA